MERSSPYLIETIFKKLRDLTKFPEEKTSLLSESISLYLQNLIELKNYVNENNPENESKIFFEIGKHLKYSKYQKGQFIKHCYDPDNFFYMIFSGNVAKIDIKYNRLYLSFKEYLIHLIKLRLLGENYIYLKCLRKNKKVFPFEENMDILTTTDINIDHYEELIKKIKKEINNSYWFTNTDKSNNIEDFLKLYNPDISESKAAFIGKEAKYPTYLPFYVFDKIMDHVSFIGQLTKPKGIKFLSSYICLNMTDIFYIDKSKIDRNSNLFSLFQRRVSEDVIKKLFEGHFLFKDTDKSFLIKNYSKYFYIQKFKKGEKLIEQNTPYEGIFFINDGVFQLNTLRSYNELNDLYFSILHAMDNFPKALMDFQSKINDFEKKTQKKDSKNIFEGLSQKQISKFTEVKKISFNIFMPPDVVGLNDVVDNKTGLNNFSLECISNEAEVYFLPNEIVTSMLTEENINSKMSEFIGKQCMLLVNEISKYKESFEKGIQLEVNNNENNKTNNNFYTLNLNKYSNIKTENNNNPITDFKQKKKYSTGFGNISSINSNFSTSKTTTYSNHYFNNHKSPKPNSKLFNKLNRNDRYSKFPNLFLSKVFNNDTDSNWKIKLKTDSNEEFFDKGYKTNLKFFDSKHKKYLSKSNHLFKSQEIYLSDREILNIQRISNEESKNQFSILKNEIKNKSSKNNLILNKKIKKGILKNFSHHKKRYKNFLQYNSFNNKNNLKTSHKILRNTFNKKINNY